MFQQRCATCWFTNERATCLPRRGLITLAAALIHVNPNQRLRFPTPELRRDLPNGRVSHYLVITETLLPVPSLLGSQRALFRPSRVSDRSHGGGKDPSEVGELQNENGH